MHIVIVRNVTAVRNSIVFDSLGVAASLLAPPETLFLLGFAYWFAWSLSRYLRARSGAWGISDMERDKAYQRFRGRSIHTSFILRCGRPLAIGSAAWRLTKACFVPPKSLTLSTMLTLPV